MRTERDAETTQACRIDCSWRCRIATLWRVVRLALYRFWLVRSSATTFSMAIMSQVSIRFGIATVLQMCFSFSWFDVDRAFAKAASRSNIGNRHICCGALLDVSLSLSRFRFDSTRIWRSGLSRWRSSRSVSSTSIPRCRPVSIFVRRLFLL